MKKLFNFKGDSQLERITLALEVIANSSEEIVSKLDILGINQDCVLPRGHRAGVEILCSIEEAINNITLTLPRTEE